MTSPTIHFKGINALRFFSAFSILLYHSSTYLHRTFPAPLKMFAHNLTLGVDFFFLISGFLISYLLLVEKKNTSTISFIGFYARRILRIFPLYFLVVGIAYLWYHESRPEIDFSKYLYFWGNFWMAETGKWTVGPLNVLWSICIEEHFYVFIPLFVWLIPLKKCHYLFWTILFISILFRTYISLTVKWNWMTMYTHTLSRCDLIAIGGLLAFYYQQKRRIPTIGTKALVSAIVLLFFMMCIVDASNYSPTLVAAFNKYLFVFPMLLIFMGVVLNDSPSNRLVRLNEQKSINYLGKISYGIYMFHSPIIDYSLQFNYLNKHFLVKIIVISLSTFLVAALSYEYFEKPILKLKKRFVIIKSRS